MIKNLDTNDELRPDSKIGFINNDDQINSIKH